MPDTNRGVDFDQLYRAHRDDIWRYLRRRSASEPEDLTTEVFLVAWRRRAELPAAPLPYLYGIARKVLANHRRSGKRRDALAERAGSDAAAAAPDHAEAFGVRDELARALGTLGDADRELLLLVAWEGLSVGEAATAVGCRSGTAAVRLHRARRRLHTALRGEEPMLMTALEKR